ncbi:bifunctional ADP-dependent NAD(P)H-hydrate dehydratase/NAD(P)H-hydrate epimerase [Urechidicola sp. KH5]
MKILNSNQIYEADKATISEEGISSFALMQRAATACFDWVHSRLQDKKEFTIKVFCGVGNNGGDGLVLSAMLHQHDYNVTCYVVDFSENRSDNFLNAYAFAKDSGCWPKVVNNQSQIPKLSASDVIVDCIFGIGLNRSVEGFTADLINAINKSNAFVLAVDVPSGLYINKRNRENDIIINATHTLTFEVPKWCFFLPLSDRYTETWEILSIGLSASFIAQIESDEFISKQKINTIYKKRTPFSHKGTHGHALLIGGSFGKIGAMVLCSKAAIKAGSGLVSVLVPNCGYEILQVSNPEVMVQTSGDNCIIDFKQSIEPSAIGIGPGLDKHEVTIKAFAFFLKSNKIPLVIDADALNILAANKELLEFIPAHSILTPHPKEFERLVGVWKDDYDKLEKLKSFSIRYGCIVVLKGAYTVIADGNRLYVNSTGNPALATAGSGDVLTGIITGLLAQGYDYVNASILGVYLHGLSADLGLVQESEESFIATDIILNLGKAFKNIKA